MSRSQWATGDDEGHAQALTAKAPRPCLLASFTGSPGACTAACVFWETGGAVLDAGCGLERLLPREDWTPSLARRWLKVRAAAGSEADWRPVGFLSVALDDSVHPP